MEGQKVQEYTVETGPNGLPIARLGRVHNLITFIQSGSQKLHYLDGTWVDDGKNPVDEATVPDEYKRQAAALPFIPAHDFEPDVLRDCEFCQWSEASRGYAKHLADAHIRPNQAKAAGAAPGVNKAFDPEAEPVTFKPEQLPPGNYVLDEDGNVVLNADGSPRKRAGRPKKTEE